MQWQENKSHTWRNCYVSFTKVCEGFIRHHFLLFTHHNANGSIFNMLVGWWLGQILLSNKFSYLHICIPYFIVHAQYSNRGRRCSHISVQFSTPDSHSDTSLDSDIKFLRLNLKIYQPNGKLILFWCATKYFGHVTHFLQVANQYSRVDNWITAFKLIHSIMSFWKTQITQSSAKANFLEAIASRIIFCAINQWRCRIETYIIVMTLARIFVQDRIRDDSDTIGRYNY